MVELRGLQEAGDWNRLAAASPSPCHNARFPLDPPLSDAGHEQAAAVRILSFQGSPRDCDAEKRQAEILGVNIQQFAERSPDSHMSHLMIMPDQTIWRRAAWCLKLNVRKGTDVHVVVCSPYSRCVQTAVKICKQLGRRPAQFVRSPFASSRKQTPQLVTSAASIL